MPRLIDGLRRLAERTRWQTLGIALTAGVLTLAGGLACATRLYAKSGFVPPLVEGQLAFDAARTRGWCGELLERGTVDVYRHAQWVDFIFIAGLLATLFVLHLMLAKAHRDRPGWQRLTLWLAIPRPAIASADIWENLVTLTMLRAPTSFPAWLAILASTLSAVQWCWSVIGTSLVAVQLPAVAWHRVGRNRATPGRGLRLVIDRTGRS